MEYTASNLTSIGAVIGATMFLMTFLKPLAANVARLKNVPTWLYTVLVAIVLTAFAHFALHTLDGSMWALTYNAMLAAMGAAGARNISKNFTTPVIDSHAKSLGDYADGGMTHDDDDDTDPPPPNAGAAISVSPLTIPGGPRIPNLAIAAMFVVISVLAGGCTTSKPFAAAVAGKANVLANRTDTYVSADAAIDEDTRQLRHNRVADFRKATTQPVEFLNVYNEWGTTRSILVDYTKHDAKLLASPLLMSLRFDMIGSFDVLVEAERKRRFIWFPLTTPMTSLPR